MHQHFSNEVTNSEIPLELTKNDLNYSSVTQFWRKSHTTPSRGR